MTTTIAGVRFNYGQTERELLDACIADVDQQMGHLFAAATDAEAAGDESRLRDLHARCEALESQRTGLQARADRLPQEPPQPVRGFEVIHVRC